MSKFPNSNIMLPALGGTALLIGVAYGVSTTNYGSDRIEALETSLAAERAVADERAAQVADITNELSSLRADAEQKSRDAANQIAALTAQIVALQAGGTPSGNVQSVAATESAMVGIGSRRGLGREAHPDELAAWDVDVLPDGRGLPVGSGDVWTGDEVFAEKCASCHGDFAEGRDNWPVLAGGFDTLANADPVKTVGSYWPYLSTVWDYVHRSMPFGNAGTLTDDEVYAITAYILYSNDLVDEDFTLSNETFGDVEMYNTDGFITDDRESTEYAKWRGEPCMENCKTAVEITRRATDVGVTPADDGTMVQSPMEEQLALLGGVEWGAETLAGSVFMGPEPVMTAENEETLTEEAVSDASSADEDTLDQVLVAAGKSAFRRCSACHAVGAGAKNKTGPQLNEVVGRTIGGLDSFTQYSSVFKSAAEDGRIWDEENLTAFLAGPKAYLEGTKMSFAGLKDPQDIEAVIEYLRSYSE